MKNIITLLLSVSLSRSRLPLYLPLSPFPYLCLSQVLCVVVETKRWRNLCLRTIANNDGDDTSDIFWLVDVVIIRGKKMTNAVQSVPALDSASMTGISARAHLHSVVSKCFVFNVMASIQRFTLFTNLLFLFLFATLNSINLSSILILTGAFFGLCKNSWWLSKDLDCIIFYWLKCWIDGVLRIKYDATILIAWSWSCRLGRGLRIISHATKGTPKQPKPSILLRKKISDSFHCWNFEVLQFLNEFEFSYRWKSKLKMDKWRARSADHSDEAFETR